VVKEIASAATTPIPVEALSEELGRPIFPRGQVFFGYLGDVIDKIAMGYVGMRWWISDKGLNMAVRDPAKMDLLAFVRRDAHPCRLAGRSN
jgi:hypothetical protein